MASGTPAASDVFRAISDPTRRAILDLLSEGERSVADLRRPFRMTQPAVSQHLGVLRKAGLVRSRQSGRESFYQVRTKPLEAVHQWVSRFVDVSDPLGHVWRLVGKLPEKRGA